MDNDGGRPIARSVDRRRWTVLIVLSIGQFMSLLDTTAVNVALPSIQRDLHISQASLSWVSNAYLVTFGACLLVAGRLGDLIGRKRVFVAGVGVFTVASLLCGLSATATMLTVARFMQGIGAAAECAMILGIIVSIFPDRAQRGRAIGVYAFIGTSGSTIGLLMGGVVTSALGWHWIFFINIPIGAVVILIGLVVIDERAGIGIRRGVDVTGGVLVTLAALLAVTGFVDAGNYGWSSPITLGSLIGAMVLGTAFVVLESRLANPLVPPRVLRSRNLLCAGAARSLFCFGSYGSFFLLVLYLQQVLGFSPLGNGLAFLPNCVFTSILSLTLIPHLMKRIDPKILHVIGLAMFAVGLALLVALPVHADFWVSILPAMIALGIAGGIYSVPNVTLAMAESSADDSGLVSGVISVWQQIGAALGIAILASVSAIRTRALLASGSGHDAAVVGGFHLGFMIAVGALVVAVVAGLLVRPTAMVWTEDADTMAALHIAEVEML